MAQTPTPRSDKPVSGATSKVPRPTTRAGGQPVERPIEQQVAKPVVGPAERPGGAAAAARSARILAWMQLVAALLLLYFTVQGFAGGGVYFPFGFGLMGLFFLYGYVRNGLKVDFGGLTTPLNLVLLLGALVCLVLGMQNEGK